MLTKSTVLLVTMLIIVIFIISIPNSKKINEVNYQAPQQNSAYEVYDFDLDIFNSAVNKISEKQLLPAVAGILPHHGLAGEYIADLSAKIAINNPKTIVILGPHHSGGIEGDFFTTNVDFQTPFGGLITDQDQVIKLLKHTEVVLNPEAFVNEQSVLAIVPYLKYFNPNAKILPIIFNYNIHNNKIQLLVNYLQKLPEKVVFIASIDFSHYLPDLQMQQKNYETIRCIDNYDYVCLASFKSDHLDSPDALITLMKIMQARGNSFIIVANTNSNQLTGNFSPLGTSYLEIAYK